MTFALVPYRQLGAPRFGGTGSVRCVERSRGLLAVASYLPSLHWAGRRVGDGREARSRVALYDERERRIATIDHDGDPILDLAFHPDAPELAIGTGSSRDQHGEILIWSWQTGSLRSVLSGDFEVVRVEYRDGGRALAILVQRRSEGAVWERPCFGAVLDDLTSRESGSSDPRVAGFVQMEPELLELPLREYPASEALARLGLANGAPIWDLAWHSDGQLAVVRDDGRVELWQPSADTPRILRTGGTAVQLLRHPDELLVNVFEASPDGGAPRSVLFAMREETLAVWRELPSQRVCSIDVHGRILARCTRVGRSQPDLVLGRDSAVVLEAELGSYHYLRLDGASELYFLRDAPKGQRPHIVLHRIDGDLALHEVMPWDAPGKNLHRLNAPSGAAVVIDDDIVRAYCVHSPDGVRTILLERCRLAPGGGVKWSRPVPAAVTALIAWPAAGCVVFALTDGTLGALDVETGAVLHDEALTLDGQPAIVSALAVHDEAIAIGTSDGRLAIFAHR